MIKAYKRKKLLIKLSLAKEKVTDRIIGNKLNRKGGSITIGSLGGILYGIDSVNPFNLSNPKEFGREVSKIFTENWNLE